jgi:hypothetical protein
MIDFSELRNLFGNGKQIMQGILRIQNQDQHGETTNSLAYLRICYPDSMRGVPYGDKTRRTWMDPPIKRIVRCTIGTLACVLYPLYNYHAIYAAPTAARTQWRLLGFQGCQHSPVRPKERVDRGSRPRPADVLDGKHSHRG